MLINLDPQLTSIINQLGLSMNLNCHITLIAPATSTTQNFTKKIEKGDGNDGEPDARRKLEFEK